jgi:hypothetical protein
MVDLETRFSSRQPFRLNFDDQQGLVSRTVFLSRRISGFAVRCLAGLFLIYCIPSSAPRAQGFGTLINKKTIKLQRKLPAAVRLPGGAIDVKVLSHDAAYANLTQTLSDLLTAELQKNDQHIHVEKNAPDAIITCTILAFQTPPPVPFMRTEVVFQKKKGVPEQPRQYYKVTGEVDVSYQARSANSKILDTDDVMDKYSENFEAGTNAADGESIASKVTNPFKRLAGKKSDETYGPPTPTELRQILLTRVAKQIAARLVNTDEIVEVPLARGKLSDTDKLAESKLWSRYVETLEMMTPFPSPIDDAYRQYNIGVGYEAMGYQTEDHAAAKKLLDKAAIAYGRAIDAKPQEKPFIDAQQRIETGEAQYRKLVAGVRTAEAAPPISNPPANSAPSSSVPAAATTMKSAASPKPPSTTTRGASASGSSSKSSSGTGPAPTPNGPSTTTAKPAPVLTNDDIIRMAKNGVDEASIIGAIRDAGAVNFDLTPDGLIKLASSGVKGNLVTAMRDKAHAATRRARPGPNGN